MGAKVSFTRFFVSSMKSIFVICNLGCRECKRIETWKIWQTFSSDQKSPTCFTWMAFLGKIHLMLSFWFLNNAVAFESRTRFRFSTSYDIKTTKLQYQCPFKKLKALRSVSRSWIRETIIQINWGRLEMLDFGERGQVDCEKRLILAKKKKRRKTTQNAPARDLLGGHACFNYARTLTSCLHSYL